MVFKDFDAALSVEEELTDSDKDRIRGQIIEDLRKRIGQMKGPFVSETRSVGGIVQQINPEKFDFLDVGDLDGLPSKPAPQGALPFGA